MAHGMRCSVQGCAPPQALPDMHRTATGQFKWATTKRDSSSNLAATFATSVGTIGTSRARAARPLPLIALEKLRDGAWPAWPRGAPR